MAMSKCLFSHSFGYISPRFTWCGFLQLAALLLLSDVCHNACLNSDMTACEVCSSEEEVPCQIQHLHTFCTPKIPDTDQSWPGPPRNLRAKVVDIGIDGYRADVTWNAPYDCKGVAMTSSSSSIGLRDGRTDGSKTLYPCNFVAWASIHSLRGFQILFHCSGTTEIGVPLCFYINLLNDTWAQRPDAHNITFKFTCIQSTKYTEVAFHLTSMPRPPENFRNTKSTSITLPGHYPKWNPIIVTDVFFTTRNVPQLKVRFQPLYPGALSHMIILMRNEKALNRTILHAEVYYNINRYTEQEHSYNLNKSAQTLTERNFYPWSNMQITPLGSISYWNISSGKNYFIWLRPIDQYGNYIGNEYIESEHFSVPAPTLKRHESEIAVKSSPNEKTITWTIVSILLLATISGTAVFFYLKKGKLICRKRNTDLSEQMTKNLSSVQTQESSGGGSTFQILFSRQEPLVEKIARSFVRFIESKVEGFVFIETKPDVDDYIRMLKEGDLKWNLLILLSEDILDFASKSKSGVDRTTTLIHNTHTMAILNFLSNIGTHLDQHNSKIFLVCIYSDLCARVLEYFPNIGQIYSVVDNIPNKKCELKTNELEQLFVSMHTSELPLYKGPMTALTPKTLTGCSQTKLLLASIQELLDTKACHRPYPNGFTKGAIHGNELKFQETNCRCSLQNMRHQTSIVEHSCDYRARLGIGVPSNCVRQSKNTCWNGKSLEQRQTRMPCHNRKGFNSTSSSEQCHLFQSWGDESGYNTAKTTLNEDEAEYIPLVTQSAETTTFVSPDSDEDPDGVSLSQKILELNQRHSNHWDNS